MAARSNDEHTEEDCRPIFLILGSVVNKEKGDRFLSEEEIFAAVATALSQTAAEPTSGPIKCIQIARGLCRIYIEGKSCRARVLTKGLVLRGKSVTLHEKNPFVRAPRGTRLTVKGLPWSVHDSVIKYTLEQQYGCEITEIQHCRIRVNGRLTDCCNGDRFVYITKLKKPIPNYNVQMGKFRVNIFYRQTAMMRPEPEEHDEMMHPAILIDSQEEFPPLKQSTHEPLDTSQHTEEAIPANFGENTFSQVNTTNATTHADVHTPENKSEDEEEMDTSVEQGKEGQSGMKQANITKYMGRNSQEKDTSRKTNRKKKKEIPVETRVLTRSHSHVSATPQGNRPHVTPSSRSHQESRNDGNRETLGQKLTPAQIEKKLRNMRDASGRHRQQRNMNAVPGQRGRHRSSRNDGEHNPVELLYTSDCD